MIQKVTLTHSVTVFVKADNEEQITNWMNCTTPMEAIKQANGRTLDETYSEEIICNIKDDSDFDIDLTNTN